MIVVAVREQPSYLDTVSSIIFYLIFLLLIFFSLILTLSPPKFTIDKH